MVSAQYNLPSGLLSSLCMVESRHNIYAIHKDDGKGNSLGICQIKIETARNLGFKGTEKQLMKPQINIKYAGAYLQHQIIRYNSIQKGVIAYNQGSAKQLTTTKYQTKVFKQWGVNENINCRLEKSDKKN
jgi:soluble lytic murein transglycosylase-like protein